ncbi:MAG: hypothetical protein ABFD89_27325 [Bryobacteraceae bacterium]
MTKVTRPSLRAVRLQGGNSARAARQNAETLRIVLAEPHTTLAPGEYYTDPVLVDHGRRTTLAADGVILMPSPACAGLPMIRIEGSETHGTSMEISGLQILHTLEAWRPSSFIEARRHLGQATNGQGQQRPGTDPGIVFRGCWFWGRASQGILRLQGAELIEFHNAIIGQNHPGAPAISIENLASTTGYKFFGGQITNFGSGWCIETRGNVQELIMFGTYMAGNSGGVLATSAGGENKYLDRVTMHGVRYEGVGPMLTEDEGVVRWLDAANCKHGNEAGSAVAPFIISTPPTLYRVWGIQTAGTAPEPVQPPI